MPNGIIDGGFKITKKVRVVLFAHETPKGPTLCPYQI